METLQFDHDRRQIPDRHITKKKKKKKKKKKNKGGFRLLTLDLRPRSSTWVSRRLLLSIITLIVSTVPVSKFFPFASLNFYLPFAFPFLLRYPWIPITAWWRYGRGGGEGTFSFWSYLPKRGDGDRGTAKSMIREGRKKEEEKKGEELLLRGRVAPPHCGTWNGRQPTGRKATLCFRP
ncbi:hypothetical protein GW17_00029417 [Ensete ventricosum]|nr:hypothetical protein GW17_00029417 [Ensete ventricosum]RZS25291.1 hypothetical protein BHM03_00058472 [Ensete ventricosum]